MKIGYYIIETDVLGLKRGVTLLYSVPEPRQTYLQLSACARAAHTTSAAEAASQSIASSGTNADTLP